GGGGGGGNNGIRFDSASPPFRQAPDGIRVATEEATAWANANVGWLVAAIGAAVLFAVALLVVGLIAQGGMAEATVDIAEGRETSLGRAWRTGRRLFWRYAGLWLTLALGAVAIAALVAATVAAIVGVGFAGSWLGADGGAAALALIVGIFVGIPLLAALMMGAIALSIVVAYAQRAIYADDAGPVTALGIGWRTLRAHVGQSLLAWLVSIGLGIGAGIAFALALLPLFALFGGIGYAAYVATGFGAPLFAAAALGAIALLAAGAVLTGIVNTFFWNYWTRAYLRLHV
ncbi:MAG TPA: hypothetical protein VFN74_23630, partial [Chloroflexota bacterium]|nr:hypothetical protein [Chloroflexota bacterium]